MIIEFKDKEKKKVVEKEQNNSSVISSALEKIGVLEKKVEYETKENKSLNERIEDLVKQMELVNKIIKKEFSLKRIFVRGLLQGLGIVIGSTILAGILYSISTKFIDKEFIRENTLKYILEKENNGK